MNVQSSLLALSSAALSYIFLATNLPGQTLTVPPPRTRNVTGGMFSSINTDTVTAKGGGTINLTGGSVTLTALLLSRGDLSALSADGSPAIIKATGVAINVSNLTFTGFAIGGARAEDGGVVT
jgi:hypothetical protein